VSFDILMHDQPGN